MTAAQQLDFMGKAIRGPHNQPPRCMIPTCCNHQQQVGRPQTHTKNTMVWNLQLLFKNLPTTTIDRYGSIKDWINEASNEKYWTALVQCLLHFDAPLPERPPTWEPTPRRSTHVPLPPASPPTDRDHDHLDAGQPTTPPQRPPPPRQPHQSQPPVQPSNVNVILINYPDLYHAQSTDDGTSQSQQKRT